jgi:DNA-binding response OmpR family regulator
VKTILILDDEKAVRESFADYFEDHHWRSLQAKSGEQALALLEKESPDGAIVDIRLGGMDGNAFIREAHVTNPKLVFVISTGSPEYEVPTDLLKLPCVSKHVFKKPVTDIAELEMDILRLIKNMEAKRNRDE